MRILVTSDLFHYTKIYLISASDAGLCSVLALLDLSATFDTVDQQILMNKLEQLVGILVFILFYQSGLLSQCA